MSALNIEALHPDFGGRITGIDLRAPISEATIDEIRAAIDDYSFVCFPGQNFDDAAQLAFTRLLGEPEESHVKLGEEGKVEYFGTIGNVQPDGTVLGNDHKKTIFLTGNNLWHSDSSFRKVPAYFSIMCAYEVPEEGGKTEFVSQRRLCPPSTRAQRATRPAGSSPRLRLLSLQGRSRCCLAVAGGLAATDETAAGAP